MYIMFNILILKSHLIDGYELILDEYVSMCFVETRYILIQSTCTAVTCFFLQKHK